MYTPPPGGGGAKSRYAELETKIRNYVELGIKNPENLDFYIFYIQHIELQCRITRSKKHHFQQCIQPKCKKNRLRRSNIYNVIT